MDNKNKIKFEKKDFEAKIIVVDDDKEFCSIIKQYLERDLHQIKIASDANKALNILDKWNCDIIITDIRLKGMDGIELMKQVFNKYNNPPKFIHMTCYSKLYSYFNLVELGSSDFIQKPFEIDVLLARVHKLVKEIRLEEKISMANNELENAMYKNKLFINQTPLAYIEWDNDMNVTEWNPAAEKIFGFKKEEAVANNMFDKISSTSKKVIKSQKSNIVLNKTRDGREIYCEWNNTPLVEKNKSIIGLSSIVQDVTEFYNLQQLQEKTFLELKENHRILDDNYKLAAQVFANIVKKEKLSHPNIRYILSPMETACGDMIFAKTRPEGGLYAFLGDFAGHGLRAALGAIPVISSFENLASSNKDLPDIIYHINDLLKEILPVGLFLAACFVYYDDKNKCLSIWNGGIPDAIIVGKNGGIKARIPSSHLAIGITASKNIDVSLETFDVSKGDRLYIYSDGIIELFNLEGEMFGQDRFESIFDNNYNPENIMETIKDSLDAHSKGTSPSDDITLLEILCT